MVGILDLIARFHVHFDLITQRPGLLGVTWSHDAVLYCVLVRCACVPSEGQNLSDTRLAQLFSPAMLGNSKLCTSSACIWDSFPSILQATGSGWKCMLPAAGAGMQYLCQAASWGATQLCTLPWVLQQNRGNADFWTCLAGTDFAVLCPGNHIQTRKYIIGARCACQKLTQFTCCQRLLHATAWHHPSFCTYFQASHPGLELRTMASRSLHDPCLSISSVLTCTP